MDEHRCVFKGRAASVSIVVRMLIVGNCLEYRKNYNQRVSKFIILFAMSFTENTLTFYAPSLVMDLKAGYTIK